MIDMVYFYIFSGALLLTALLTVTATRPIYSVLFLSASFFNASALMILLGAKFVGILQLILYLAAISVFILFVVSQLGISFAEAKTSIFSKLKALIVALAVGGELVFLYFKAPIIDASADKEIEIVGTISAIGEAIFTDYIYPLQISAIVLLVAMVGATVLTLKGKEQNDEL